MWGLLCWKPLRFFRAAGTLCDVFGLPVAGRSAENGVGSLTAEIPSGLANRSSSNIVYGV